MGMSIGMSLSYLILAIEAQLGHKLTKIKLKPQYITDIRREYEIGTKEEMVFMGVRIEELSEGNRNAIVIEE